MSLLHDLKIIGLFIFLEKRKTRQLVGELRFDDKKRQFIFSYQKEYLYSDNIIPMGPELPLTKQHYIISYHWKTRSIIFYL